MSTSNENILDQRELDEKVLKLVKKITKTRNKACHQNILTFAQRENDKIQMDDIKVSLSRLTSDGLIYDLNKDKPKKTGEGNESFKIVGEGGADAICQTEDIHIQDGDCEKLFSDEAYINDKCNETLRKLI